MVGVVVDGVGRDWSSPGGVPVHPENANTMTKARMLRSTSAAYSAEYPLALEATLRCGELGDRVELEKVELEDDVARFALIDGKGVVESRSDEDEPHEMAALAGDVDVSLGEGLIVAGRFDIDIVQGNLVSINEHTVGRWETSARLVR